MSYRPRATRGFTLIELMIVVAITGILAAIAIPKFSALLRKSQEGATKGNLGRIRSALSIYYGDMEGEYPRCDWGSNSDVFDVLVGKYIDQVPLVHPASFHASQRKVFCHQDNDNGHDGEGWGYDGDYESYLPRDKTGTIWVMCSHTDSKNNRWYSY